MAVQPKLPAGVRTIQYKRMLPLLCITSQTCCSLRVRELCLFYAKADHTATLSDVQSYLLDPVDAQPAAI